MPILMCLCKDNVERSTYVMIKKNSDNSNIYVNYIVVKTSQVQAISSLYADNETYSDTISGQGHLQKKNLCYH